MYVTNACAGLQVITAHRERRASVQSDLVAGNVFKSTLQLVVACLVVSCLMCTEACYDEADKEKPVKEDN